MEGLALEGLVVGKAKLAFEEAQEESEMVVVTLFHSLPI